MLSIALLLALAPQGLGPIVRHPSSGHGYRISEREVSIDEALELARLAGGTLLCLESAEEEAWVRGTFGAERTWLGLEFPRERWSDGTPVEHLHWDEGEPSRGDREAFTILGWNRENGAWNDVSASGDRFRAVVELTEDAPLEPAVLPVRDPPRRGVLLFAVEGLTLEDVEDERAPELARVWGEGSHALAAADPSGDALASWGLLTQGVGQSKSGLVADGKPPRYVAFPTLLERLEETWPAMRTQWILDEPELSRRLASGGRMDVRVARRDEARERALAEALSGEPPACLVIGHTLLRGKEGKERLAALRLVDAELGRVRASLAALPERTGDGWLLVLAGTPPHPGEARAAREAGTRARGKKSTALEVPRAPLVFLGPGFAPGPWRGTIGLADVVPTVSRFLGLEPGVAWALDGRALEPRALELGRDLLDNGNAEAQRCWRLDPGPLPGWTSDGALQVEVYRANLLALEHPGPTSRGTNLFCGSAAPLARMEQEIDVTPLAEAIDAKSLVAELSGWLGGVAENEGRATLALTCLDAQGRELERSEVEPVTRAERRKELGAEQGVARTGLVERRLALPVPKGTRLLRVTLLLEGPKRSDRACADELALVLRPR